MGELNDEAATALIGDLAMENGILSPETHWLVREVPPVGIRNPDKLVRGVIAIIASTYGDMAEIIVERGIQHLCKFGDIRWMGEEMAERYGVTSDEVSLYWQQMSPLHRVSWKIAEDLQLLEVFIHFLRNGDSVEQSCSGVRANMLVFGDPSDEGPVKPIPYEMLLRSKQWLELHWDSGRRNHDTWNSFFWASQDS